MHLQPLNVGLVNAMGCVHEGNCNLAPLFIKVDGQTYFSVKGVLLCERPASLLQDWKGEGDWSHSFRPLILTARKQLNVSAAQSFAILRHCCLGLLRCGKLHIAIASRLATARNSDAYTAYQQIHLQYECTIQPAKMCISCLGLPRVEVRQELHMSFVK